MKFLPKSLPLFIWHFLKSYKLIIFLYVGTAIIAGLWSPVNGLLMKRILNTLSLNQNLSLLTLPAILLICNFLIIDNLTWRFINYLNYKYRGKIKKRIISETFDFVLKYKQKYFHDNLSGRIANRITTLADNIEHIIYPIAPIFIRSVSLLIIAFVCMYLVNLVFFYTLAAWLVVFSLLSYVMSKRLIKLSDNLANADSAISGQLVDAMSNSMNIRIFAKRGYEVKRLDTALNTSKQKFKEKELFSIFLQTVQGASIAFMFGFMIYFLIHLYQLQQVTIGDFALILGLTIEVGYITWYGMEQLNEFHQAYGKCKQSLSNLIITQNIQYNQKKDLNISKGEITLSNVDFEYNTNEPLFKKESIQIEGGQKVGLVGYSGGGKSTFINLILRIFEISKGNIYIDGQNIQDVSLDSLYKNIALIPQEPTLFNRTLFENIRYGRTDATDEEVLEASKQAFVHDFVSNLSDGYNTLVGERGIKLSGGQRQRIAIARAILKNAPILILDEATSQLDSVTEKDIQECLWKLMENKTTIVIAHRLSTLLNMDRILVFSQGQIIEDGSHHDLLSKNGLYKTLWETQFSKGIFQGQSSHEAFSELL